MGKHEDILIKKASGKEEYFSFQKLRNSLMNSNATYDEAEAIVQTLKNEIYKGISTNKIYSMAFRMLKQQNSHNASRYYLKQGMMELGPSGFAFEKYIAALFNAQGYHAQNGVFLKGHCVTHEIDVYCRKGDETMLMECKYKNQGGLTVDVKVPLYINSRFQDVLENKQNNISPEHFKGWIVTNARFTDDASTYGTCRNINLLGWDYPVNHSLKDLIDQIGLYPLTCLTTITQEEKQQFLEKGIVLVKDLCNNEKIIQKIIKNTNRIKEIIYEGHQLCDR